MHKKIPNRIGIFLCPVYAFPFLSLRAVDIDFVTFASLTIPSLTLCAPYESSHSDQLRSTGYFASIFLQFFKLQKNLRFTPCFFASDKSHDRFACSFVNALATASALYQLLSVAHYVRCLIDRVERCRFALYKSETIDPAYKQYAVA